jgi:hypothetical protein
VGATDDGSIRRDYITDQILVDLSALKSIGSILLPLSITVSKIVVGDRAVAVVEVRPSDHICHRCATKGGCVFG